MPASRTDSKSPRMKRREQVSPVDGASVEFDDITTNMTATTTSSVFTEEQVKLRAMIPAITPAHGPESTSSAILAALSLGSHRPNSHTRRKSDGHVNRPPNAFIVFRRAQVQNMPANVTQHQQRISNLTALFWRVLTHSEQNTWYALSDDIKKLHSILFPDYNFNPRNPDGTKKAMLPRAGLTPERLDFAWNEAQLLIQKHTVMVEHPVAPPASSTGKLPRPKPPRKGQGTRAKERREKEAAERAAAAAAQATAIEAAAFDDDEYAPERPLSGTFDSRSYFSTIEEESSAASPNDAIAWRPDFNLEGSVSSRSSPSANSWSELVGPLDSNAESVDPLDAGYVPQNGYDASQPSNAVDYNNMIHYAVPYQMAPMFTGANAQPPSMPFVSQAPKPHDAFAGVSYVQATSTGGPVHSFTSYYDPHATSAAVLHSAEFMQGHSEAQYVFHDMDPTASYLDAPVYATGMPTEYVW